MIDPTKKYTYKSSSARVIATDAAGPYPVVALVETLPGKEIVVWFTADGVSPTQAALKEVPKITWRTLGFNNHGADVRPLNDDIPVVREVVQLGSVVCGSFEEAQKIFRRDGQRPWFVVGINEDNQIVEVRQINA